MKRSILALLVVGIVLFGACSAQNANAQNANIAQKIVGTWVDNSTSGTTWVFSANGTLKKNDSDEEAKYGVTDTKLVIRGTMYDNGIYDISISPDGKTLILSPTGGNTKGYWLTKK